MSKYPLYAGKANSSIIDEATWNGLISFHDAELIYEGTAFNSYAGGSGTEYACYARDHCGNFVATGVTEIGRFTFYLAKDGTGADVTLEIRSGMAPATGDDGTLLKSITIPKEWLPDTAALVTIPVALTGLTAGNTYYWRIRQAGDSTNHFHLYGAAAEDGTYKSYYRAAATGNWTAENSITFYGYSGIGTTPKVIGAMMAQAVQLWEYTGSLITTIKLFVPDVDDTTAGIRDTITLTWSGNYLLRAVVS